MCFNRSLNTARPLLENRFLAVSNFRCKMFRNPQIPRGDTIRLSFSIHRVPDDLETYTPYTPLIRPDVFHLRFIASERITRIVIIIIRIHTYNSKPVTAFFCFFLIEPYYNYNTLSKMLITCTRTINNIIVQRYYISGAATPRPTFRFFSYVCMYKWFFIIIIIRYTIEARSSFRSTVNWFVHYYYTLTTSIRTNYFTQHSKSSTGTSVKLTYELGRVQDDN